MYFYTYLQGGLGNQMFQYAASLSALKEHPQFIGFKLDTSFFKGQQVKVVKNGITGRNYDLDIFNITYSDTCDAPEGSLLLKGWFQNIKEFDNVSEQIREEFKFNVNFSEETKKMKLNIINSKYPIAIHVRRGDFIYNINCYNYHGVLGEEYYDKSIKIMNEKYPNAHYFIFSEDYEWCKEKIIPKLNNFTYVGCDCNDYKDSGHLYLMTNCKSHIIANSTYSWWGAWLAHSNFVIGPRIWNKGSDGTENIMQNLQNWISI